MSSEIKSEIKSKIKCDVCKQKLGLMEMTCKCGKKLCITHIQCEHHICTYDHKKEGQVQLKKQLDTDGLNTKVIKI